MTAALRAGGQAGSIAPNCKTIPILRRKSYCQARKSKGRDCGSAVTVSQSPPSVYCILYLQFARLYDFVLQFGQDATTVYNLGCIKMPKLKILTRGDL